MPSQIGIQTLRLYFDSPCGSASEVGCEPILPFAAPCINVCSQRISVYGADKMIMLKPNIDRIPAYVSALQRGWSPDNLRSEAAKEQIASISKDPTSFVSNLDDPAAKGGPITLPDGSKVPRLPSIRRWIWDDEFCGHISLRWKPGTEELPPTCSGHIGYSVVPWRRGEGLASAALVAILPEAKAVGLNHVTITTSPDNPASVRVIEKAGGTLERTYTAGKSLGGHETLEFRISLAE